jgi:hypothetical protein
VLAERIDHVANRFEAVELDERVEVVRYQLAKLESCGVHRRQGHPRPPSG